MMANEIKTSLKEAKFKVPSMVCEGCAEKLTIILSAITGVKEVKSYAFQKKIQVIYNPELIMPEGLRKVLEEEGYQAVEL